MLTFLNVRGSARRDELISLLWGEIAEDKARNAFRQSLHRLRSALGEQVLPQDRDVVSIGNRALLACDRDAFVHACDEERWATAVQSYSGDFLEGFEVGEAAFDRWADAERIKLRSRLAVALRHAANEALESGRFSDAAQLAQRLSLTAPFDEQAVTLEASILVAAGRPEEAAAAVRRFIVRLREELELDASTAVRALLARLERAEVRKATPSGDHEGVRALPFVGRDAELSRLIAALNELAAEHGSTVVVEGEAGIGKTRLIDEFAIRARSLGPVLILRGREHSTGSTIPYASLAEALRPLVRAPGVAGTSKHLLAEAARLLPELRDSFELPEVQWVEDDAGRLRFFEGLAALIDAAAYERPVCIALDDMQHASAATLELVAYLAGRLRTSPVLLIVAFRADGAGAQTGERLHRLAEAAAVDDDFLILVSLSNDDGEALVRALAAREDRLSPATVERIVRLAAGRPVQLIDLTRRALAGETAAELPVPLRDMLWARLQATTPSQRRVFFAASLFERHASVALLAAAAHLPEPAAADAVRALLDAGLLYDAGGGLAIAHDATASFINDASGIAGRAMLADWAAEALSHEPDASDAELANLYALAGQTDRACAYARKGAFAAASMGAMPEAMRLLSIALTFAPDDAARAQIESLISAFGQPKLRLAAAVAADIGNGGTEPLTEPAEPVEPDVAREARPEPVAAAAPTLGSRTLLRHATARQWLASIAISLLIILLGLQTRRDLLARRPPSSSAIDSLVLVERGSREDDSLRLASGEVGSSPLPMSRLAESDLTPSWLGEVRSPWADPLVAPNGRSVALRHMTEHGSDVYVIGADGRDTIPVTVGGRDNTALDWSPDGKQLLVARSRTLPDGGFDSDLYIYAADGKQVVPIDTSAARSIVEAKWSPAGTLVAWVARVGSTRQQEIFVSAPDGSGLRDVSLNPAEDYHPAWSPDGTLLAFTSTRSGARRIFAYDFENTRVWPVTDRDGDDRARFSPDGRYLAFESTRDGDAAVYLARPLGGIANRITPRGRQFSIVDWRGRRPPYLKRLRIVGPSNVAIGDVAKYALVGIDQYGAPLSVIPAAWSLPRRGPLAPADSSDTDTSTSQTFRAASIGDEMLVASVEGWRADTLHVSVAPAQPLNFHDDFSDGLSPSRWMSLGSPLPYVAPFESTGPLALHPNGDLEWDSGVLSRPSFELAAGLSVEARVFAPFGGRPSSAALSLALVPSASETSIDKRAPRFGALLGATWDGQSGAITYSVGAQTSSDPIEPGRSHVIRISIQDAGVVVFSLDGSVRWRSSLRYLGDVRGARAQLWIGGRATGSSVAVTAVDVRTRR